MIVWLNGAFGAGKTSLANELLARRPSWILYDPEFLGFALREYVAPQTGDFQDLPEWRHLVAETALALRRHRATTLVMPMTVVRPAYLAEIAGPIRSAGQTLIHYFLDVPADVVRSRIIAQVIHPDDVKRDEAAREWRLAQIDRCVVAADELSSDVMRLRVTGQTVAELADRILADVEQRAELLDAKGKSS
jgi:hypothetical protein